MNLDTPDGLRLLTELAGIRLPQEREAALVAGLGVTRRIAEALAQRRYSESEPASAFLVPPSKDR